MTALLLRSGRPRIAVRANWGRWIVDCPRVSSHALWVEAGTPFFICPACGAEAELVWPDEATRVGIERLLMMRPNEADRNWVPGETLHDLLDENVAHAIFPGSTGDELEIIGSTITRDTLPSPSDSLDGTFRRALGAA